VLPPAKGLKIFIMNKGLLVDLKDYGGEHEAYCLLGFGPFQSGRNSLTFQRTVMPPSSGSENKLLKQLERSKQQLILLGLQIQFAPHRKRPASLWKREITIFILRIIRNR
jgi:hypothetical protein